MLVNILPDWFDIYMFFTMSKELHFMNNYFYLVPSFFYFSSFNYCMFFLVFAGEYGKQFLKEKEKWSKWRGYVEKYIYEIKTSFCCLEYKTYHFKFQDRKVYRWEIIWQIIQLHKYLWTMKKNYQWLDIFLSWKAWTGLGQHIFLGTAATGWGCWYITHCRNAEFNFNGYNLG